MQKSVVQEKKQGNRLPASPAVIRRTLSLAAGEAAIAVFGGVCIHLLAPEAQAVVWQDGLSLIPLAGMILIVLLAAGLLQDFGRAFVYCIKGHQDITGKQMDRAVHSVKVSMATALITGVAVALVQAIHILVYTDMAEVEFLGLNFSVPCIGLLYGVFVTLLLLPVYARLKADGSAKE